TSVTSNTITVTIPLVSSAEVVAAWAAMTNYVPISRAFQISSVSGYLEYTEDNYIPQGMWYREYLDMGFTTYELVDVDQFNYNKLVGVPFDNGIGPIFTPKNATEIILNFVSVNGFYKLNQNNEVAIIAQIRVTVYELDINGDETGNSTPFVIDYESN